MICILNGFFRITLITLCSMTLMAQSDFTVHTKKINQPHVEDVPILLVYPPHQSTLSEGVVTFEWEAAHVHATGDVKVRLEKVGGKSPIILNSKKSIKQIYCGPGNYRWKVTTPDGDLESHWRSFHVISSKSEIFHRQQRLPASN